LVRLEAHEGGSAFNSTSSDHAHVNIEHGTLRNTLRPRQDTGNQSQQMATQHEPVSHRPFIAKQTRIDASPPTPSPSIDSSRLPPSLPHPLLSRTRRAGAELAVASLLSREARRTLISPRETLLFGHGEAAAGGDAGTGAGGGPARGGAAVGGAVGDGDRHRVRPRVRALRGRHRVRELRRRRPRHLLELRPPRHRPHGTRPIPSRSPSARLVWTQGSRFGVGFMGCFGCNLEGSIGDRLRTPSRDLYFVFVLASWVKI
jgi:hypothetical protein